MPNLLSANLQDGEGRHIEFRKISLYPDSIKISAPNLVKSCITVIRRWSRDLKAETEVNTRDVISRPSANVLECSIMIAGPYQEY